MDIADIGGGGEIRGDLRWAREVDVADIGGGVKIESGGIR
jgi:hypothetical protein